EEAAAVSSEDTASATEPIAEGANGARLTDEEAFAIGDRCARGLQRLYLDYLYFEEDRLLLKPTGNTAYAAFETEGFSDGEFLFYEVSSDTIRTYDELEAVFNASCTEEYTKKLLSGESVFYKSVDGRLFMYPTENCFMGFRNVYLTDRERRGEDEIVFTFAEIADDLLAVSPSAFYAADYERDPSYDRAFTMTVVRREGEWLISDCGDAAAIGYLYRADTFGERGEYGDEEARRLAEKFASEIKRAFLDDPSEGELTEGYESLRLIDWYRWGKELRFVYRAEGGDPAVDPDDRYLGFSLADRDGAWQLEACDRPEVFGYCYAPPDEPRA
ncbi:MAG: hypothetical protein NC237_04840, partial [Eubacterium sp.]|nr:hypothetical protein [Eubacterium sp.]